MNELNSISRSCIFESLEKKDYRIGVLSSCQGKCSGYSARTALSTNIKSEDKRKSTGIYGT